MTAAEWDKIFPQSATSHSITFCNDISKFILLFLVGGETMSNMIGNMLIAFHRHPQQLE